MKELRYFFTTRKDGNMNTQAKFYKKGMTKEEIRKDFDLRRISFGSRNGFNGLKIVVPTMKNSNNSHLYSDGKSVNITNEMISDYDDLYNFDVEADILTMDSNIDDIALAYPVADCPVVFAYDANNNAVGMAHCGGEYINRDLPSQLVDAMHDTFDSKIKNLSIYIGPFIHTENYVYDRYPKWATSEQNWRDCIIKHKGLYHIDLAGAITKQLVDKGIDQGSIYASVYDTATNDMFYSNSVSSSDPTKAGRFYEGCYFTTDVIQGVKRKYLK